MMVNKKQHGHLFPDERTACFTSGGTEADPKLREYLSIVCSIQQSLDEEVCRVERLTDGGERPTIETHRPDFRRIF
jgi:hypothetical protein